MFKPFCLHLWLFSYSGVWRFLKRKEKIAKKAENNESNDPVHWINIDDHHIHVKPPSTAVVLEVQIVHPVGTVWELPPSHWGCPPVESWEIPEENYFPATELKHLIIKKSYSSISVLDRAHPGFIAWCLTVDFSIRNNCEKSQFGV